MKCIAERVAERFAGWLAVGLLAALVGCAAAEKPPLLQGSGEAGYPTNAKQAGVEGFVVVEYDVLADGRVANARVIEAEPEGVFEKAALATVASWRFDVINKAPRTQQVSRLTYSLDGDDYRRYD